jgi:hypothetical protein
MATSLSKLGTRYLKHERTLQERRRQDRRPNTQSGWLLAFEAMIEPDPRQSARPETGESSPPVVAPEAKAELEASAEGLSHVEAKKRLAQFGFNELPEKKVNPVLKVLTGRLSK